jgi:chromosome partitioning protein
MPVICLLNQKGGVGKTTLALNLAADFATAGDAVLYVDADPQGSALDWSAVRQKEPLFNVVGMPRNAIHKQLPMLAVNYAYTFIDGPPLVGEVARSAIIASNLIVIPVQPSGPDKWSTKTILDLVTEARVFKDNLKAVIAINRKIVGTAIGKSFAEEFAADYPDFPVLRTEISQYVAFTEALTTGSTVLEMHPDGQAARQVHALANELKKLLNHDQETQRSTKATAG